MSAILALTTDILVRDCKALVFGFIGNRHPLAMMSWTVGPCNVDHMKPSSLSYGRNSVNENT